MLMPWDVQQVIHDDDERVSESDHFRGQRLLHAYHPCLQLGCGRDGAWCVPSSRPALAYVQLEVHVDICSFVSQQQTA